MGASHVTGAADVPPPVTIAWAEKDRLLLPRQAERARRALPWARHVTLFGCGHVPPGTTPRSSRGRSSRRAERRANYVVGVPPASLGSSLDSFFDAVGSFADSVASLRFGPLLLGLLFFLAYLTLRSRAFFHILRAAYPTERFEWRRVWGAYIAAYGFNGVVPARGGDVIKLFLTKTSVPNSSYPAVGSSMVVENVFDLTMGVFILAFAFSQGVFPKPPDFAELPAFDLQFLAANPRFTLFLLTVLGHPVARRVRAAQRARAGVLGAGAPGLHGAVRPAALLPRGLARAVRRLAVSLHGVLVPARGVQRRRLGAQRAARPGRQRGRRRRPVHARRRRRPAGPARAGVRRRGGRRDGRRLLGRPADRDRRVDAGVGFAALVFIFGFRSFKEVIAAGRASREAEKAEKAAAT
jgi:hypothetical protein